MFNWPIWYDMYILWYHFFYIENTYIRIWFIIKYDIWDIKYNRLNIIDIISWDNIWNGICHIILIFISSV